MVSVLKGAFVSSVCYHMLRQRLFNMADGAYGIQCCAANVLGNYNTSEIQNCVKGVEYELPTSTSHGRIKISSATNTDVKK